MAAQEARQGVFLPLGSPDPTHPGKIACSAFYAVDFSAEQLRVMGGQTSADDG